VFPEAPAPVKMKHRRYIPYKSYCIAKGFDGWVVLDGIYPKWKWEWETIGDAKLAISLYEILYFDKDLWVIIVRFIGVNPENYNKVWGEYVDPRKAFRKLKKARSEEEAMRIAKSLLGKDNLRWRPSAIKTRIEGLSSGLF
jgi:hypothetical protein